MQCSNRLISKTVRFTICLLREAAFFLFIFLFLVPLRGRVKAVPLWKTNFFFRRPLRSRGLGLSRSLKENLFVASLNEFYIVFGNSGHVTGLARYWANYTQPPPPITRSQTSLFLKKIYIYYRWDFYASWIYHLYLFRSGAPLWIALSVCISICLYLIFDFFVFFILIFIVFII